MDKDNCCGNGCKDCDKEDLVGDCPPDGICDDAEVCGIGDGGEGDDCQDSLIFDLPKGVNLDPNGPLFWPEPHIIEIPEQNAPVVPAATPEVKPQNDEEYTPTNECHPDGVGCDNLGLDGKGIGDIQDGSFVGHKFPGDPR